MEAAKETGTNGMGMAQNGMLTHISADGPLELVTKCNLAVQQEIMKERGFYQRIRNFAG
jgi:hypothetical protein